MIPAGEHLEIQCRESAPGESDCEKAEEGETGHLVKTSEAPSKDSSSNAEPAQLPPEEQRSPSAENTDQPVADTSYVDIHRQENTQWDYSQVKEVNGETVLTLQNKNLVVSADAQTQEGCAEAGGPASYSVVKEVDGGNVVLLHRHDSADSFCKKEDQSTEWTMQKTKILHATDCSKVTALQITGNGYVM